jgi:NADH-quinone oxidoreductase subunit J
MPDLSSIPLSALAILLAAASLWLMLPRGGARGRGIGMILGAVALGLGAARLPSLGQWMADGIFLVLAGVTVTSAVGAITFRNPVYCAIWFGLSLLGVAGLFFFVGAQFLAVATVVVYAGAILVTFLFVLMLAQPEGKASYDRTGWETSVSAALGMIIVAVLSISISGALSAAKGDGGSFRQDAKQLGKVGSENFLRPPSEDAMAANILAPRHVARFGDEVFSRHLIAVEVAGVLLLAALVGAAVIVERGQRSAVKQPRSEGGDQKSEIAD